MADVEIMSIEGKASNRIALPAAFEEEVRPDLIRRAVLAESSLGLQPQGHFVLAGMQTTATYYGRMHAYRTGRHMGRAIRPRQKLGAGVQGLVRRVPSSVKGKRAHPHMIEKQLTEAINTREYRKALASAVASTKPVVVSNAIESVSKTKDMSKIFNAIINGGIPESRRVIRKGLRRSARTGRYTKSLLFVAGSDCAAVRAAGNIAGVDSCKVSDITANMLSPGGNTGRTVVWSESALSALDESINTRKL